MGFESPNYTQAPNDFFDMIPDMSDAELRVTLVMIRQTFGFHRDNFKMGINKLKAAAGLSRNGAKDGAEAAEKRGTFMRVNPDAQTEAEWHLVIDQPETRSPSDHEVGHPVTTPPPPSDQQVGVKERVKKIKVLKKKEGASAKPKTEQPPEIILFKEVVNHYPKANQRESVIEAIQSINTRLGRYATANDLCPFFKEWGKVSGNEWSLVWLTEWAVSNKIGQTKPAQPKTNNNQAAAQRVAERIYGNSR